MAGEHPVAQGQRRAAREGRGYGRSARPRHRANASSRRGTCGTQGLARFLWGLLQLRDVPSVLETAAARLSGELQQEAAPA